MSESVRPINAEILGMTGTDNLIPQTIPGIAIIDVVSYRPGDHSHEIRFFHASKTVGRLGIFAAKKGSEERAVIMLLPEAGRPDGVLICITQGFSQARAALEPLGWSNPLSKPFIEFCLLKHVINRWGAQMLASGKNLALMYIVRSAGKELGPFARDGAFVKFTLDEISKLTNNGFSTDHIEAFTFSSGVADFNNFVNASSGNLNYTAVYAVDPSNSLPIARPNNVYGKAYVSGAVGGFLPGVEPMPLKRWVNEELYATYHKIDPKNYLHNHTMPMYCLYLALKQR